MQFLAALIGIANMLIIDISGSILSRKLRFNYAWFGILSAINFMLIGYLQAYMGFAKTTFYSAAFVALLDATIGLYLSQKLNAYTGSISIDNHTSINFIATVITVIVGGFLGWIGGMLS